MANKNSKHPKRPQDAPVNVHGDAAVKVHGDAPVTVHGNEALKLLADAPVKVNGEAFFRQAPDKFQALYNRLKTEEFFGIGGEEMPKGPSLKEAVEEGSCSLPKSYIDGYAVPLEGHLPHLERQNPTDQLKPRILEAIAGAVYQHRDGPAQNGSTPPAPLRRFLAVISNLYRSFLADEKRTGINIKLSTVLPPLATFQHDGSLGPFTLTDDDLRDLIGADAGVVSMPALYAKHPVLWAALAHEVGGHGITHADKGLLEELANGVPAALSGVELPADVSRDRLSQLWFYWMDEAAADVYGILNIGPAFVLNQAMFLSLCSDSGRMPPKLRMESGFDPDDPMRTLDPHPTDILRLHLAAGVIDTLLCLKPEVRSSYNDLIEQLAHSLGEGNTVTIKGNISPDRDHVQMIDLSVPLELMQRAARSIGRYIATANLAALSGHSIQEIETWDNRDEDQSLTVKEALVNHGSIDLLGDDAQLLAGATLALLKNPELYDDVTKELNKGLDFSFRRDPIWGSLQPHRAIVRYRS